MSNNSAIWQYSTVLGSVYSTRLHAAAARLIYHLRPHDHITDALATQHWLRVSERVQYKIAVLTYKVLHNSAPRYLGPLVAVADLHGRSALRSANTSRLVIPPIKLSTVGSRAFPVAAAHVWNGRPEAVISSSSLQSFRRQLKTHLFSTIVSTPDSLTAYQPSL